MGQSQIHNLFYAPAKNISKSEIIIDGEEIHHLKNVLRKKVDDVIFVTDGKGCRYKIKIKNITKSRINTEILDKIYFERNGIINLTLAFVPLKGLRNDFILEKGTELGVRRFLPFISRFAVLPKLNQSKLVRFKKIAINAMLQSQQCYTPEIIFQKDLNNLLKKISDFDLILLSDKNGKLDIPSGVRSVLFIVGPEGGFDDLEIEIFKNSGAKLLSLGSNRLRSETAAICGIVKILSAYGDI